MKKEQTLVSSSQQEPLTQSVLEEQVVMAIILSRQINFDLDSFNLLSYLILGTYLSWKAEFHLIIKEAASITVNQVIQLYINIKWFFLTCKNSLPSSCSLYFYSDSA